MQHLITEIQSLGVIVPEEIIGRRGGAGPAEGRAFLLNGLPVSVPIAAAYVSNSPFSLKKTEYSEYDLLKNGKSVSPVQIVPEPEYYAETTDDGISYRQIALLHGKDCLATTVLQHCVHWKNSQKCSFCATENSLSSNQTIAKKSPAQLKGLAMHFSFSTTITE